MPIELLRILKSYLYHRNMMVSFENGQGKPFPIISGVPQGSVLGPILYNYYANSVLELPLSKNTKLISYADDLIVLKPIFVPEDENYLQQDLCSISAEYSSLQLNINAKKSSLFLCSLAPKKPELNGAYYVGDEVILESKRMKYLGVYLDRKLNFGHHWELRCLATKKLISVMWNRYFKFGNGKTFDKV